MKPTIKTPKSTYFTLAAGFALGAVCMGTVYTGATVSKAVAQQVQTFAPRHISSPSAESMAELRNLDASFANLADFVGPAVVDIKSVNERQQGPNGERVPVAGGQGSGFIFRPDGYIITNDHVVGNFSKVTVTLRDGREFPGKVTRAEDSDIALVKIEAKDLPTLSFSDSSKVRPGQFAMAVGAPFGFENSVTVGHVSALHRADTEIQGRVYADLIQTDTSINMGNSGGPLVNIDGQVIGINTAIYSPSGGSAGIGFAIPSNQARLIADTLIQKGKITRAYMGVVPETLKEYKRAELKVEGGAVLTTVPSDGPAGMAGLKENDVVVRIGQTPIRSSIDLRNSMMQYAAGNTVEVEYLRDGQRRTAQVKLATPPARPTPVPQQRPGQRSPFPRFQLPPGFENPFGEDGPEVQVVPPVTDGQPRLGVGVDNLSPELRKQFNIPANVKGAVVTSVVPGSVAAGLGMKPGDVVQFLGDKAVDSAAGLVEAMKSVKKGESRRVKFTRYGTDGTRIVDSKVTF
jgi:serine protease Do